ncbi:MAG: SBBP repeat-containing protein [Candidatus Odinarchaeota archaeon]
MKGVNLLAGKKALILLMVLLLVQIPGSTAKMNLEGNNSEMDVEGNQGEINEEVRRNVERTLNGFTGGFLENKGQKNGEIYYYTDSSRLSMGFAASEVRFIYHGTGTGKQDEQIAGEVMKRETASPATVFSLTFPGSNAVIPVGEEPTGIYSSYFAGTDESERSVNSYYNGKVVYRGLYDNIDLVYGLKDGQIKYEFFVYPEGRVKDIQLQWNGPVTLEIHNGDIQVNVQPRTVDGEDHSCGFSFTDTAPVSYQSRTRDRPVESSFRLLDQITYGFSVKNYDQTKLLIIDPLLSSSLVLVGGSNEMYDVSDSFAITADSAGNLYVTGSFWSTDFPTTANAYNETDGPSSDVFVFKLTPDGTELLYSTYISGNDRDFGYAIAVDYAGNAHVTGYTLSTDFPTTANAYNESDDGTGNFDAFILKLSAGGNNLIYSTYLGGSNSDFGRGIAMDGSGNVLTVGITSSTDFPATTNAYDEANNGGSYDAFVCKLTLAGNGANDLLYSTYIGGSGSDYGLGIALDSEGTAYITGTTGSTNFPTTANAYDEANNGGEDAFVCKLMPVGNGNNDLNYSTYIGGSTWDGSDSIAIDSEGNVVIAGSTQSTDFPTTVNAYDQTLGGGSSMDVFICKLSPDGSGANDLLYSTYVGGSGYDKGLAIAVDSDGSAFVTGHTDSSDFPAVIPHDASRDEDAFVFKLSPDGSDLLYSTYFGGSDMEYGFGIVVDSDGHAYATGITVSDDFPALRVHGPTTGPGFFVFRLSNPAFLSPPRNIFAAVIDDQQVLLTWGVPDDSSSPVTSYLVNRSTASGSGYSFLAKVTGTVFIDSAAVPGIPYYYVVTAVNELGKSLPSNEVTITVPVEPPPPPTSPGAPADLACAPGENTVYLNWSAPVDDGGLPITFYRVYRGVKNESYLFLGLTNSTAFNDTSAAGGITYYYTVTAVNAAGESLFSNEASATPTAPVTKTTTTTTTMTTTTTITTTESSRPSPGWTLFILIPSLAVLFFRKKLMRKTRKLQRNSDGGP